LTDRVRQQSEDVLTQAYMKAADESERAAVIGLADPADDGSGRFIPLLCYAMQFDQSPEVRRTAAERFAALKLLHRGVSRSAIARLIGHVAEQETEPYRRERMLYCLEEFLRNVCGYEIPGASRSESKMPLDAKGRAVTTVVRTPPEHVWAWWQSDGRRMAENGGFDK
jgi:hypothetical protein